MDAVIKYAERVDGRLLDNGTLRQKLAYIKTDQIFHGKNTLIVNACIYFVNNFVEIKEHTRIYRRYIRNDKRLDKCIDKYNTFAKVSINVNRSDLCPYNFMGCNAGQYVFWSLIQIDMCSAESYIYLDKYMLASAVIKYIISSKDTDIITKLYALLEYISEFDNHPDYYEILKDTVKIIKANIVSIKAATKKLIVDQ